MSLTVYCTESDLQRLFSSQGVISFADHDEDGTSDSGVVTDCIEQATEEINLYCNGFYSPAGLASSKLVNRWCTTLAVVFLCARRGNPVPESLQSEFQRIMELLERIRTGQMRLPNVGMKANLSPSFSNLEVDRRYPDSRVRVVTNSSDKIPTALTQKTAGGIPNE